MTKKYKAPNVSPDLRGRVTQDSPFAEIVERAYRVFERPSPTDNYSCTCPSCMDAEIKENFLKFTARELPFYYLSDWYNSAVTPDLPKEFWAWLLPRIFEALAGKDSCGEFYIADALTRFPIGDKEQWTDEEWDVISSFQKFYLEHYPSVLSEDLDTVVGMFANAGWPLEELFRQVWEFPTDKLVEELHRQWCPSPDRRRNWVTAFGENESFPLKYWVDSQLFERMLECGCDETVPKQLADKALQVADWIDYVVGNRH